MRGSDCGGAGLGLGFMGLAPGPTASGRKHWGHIFV